MGGMPMLAITLQSKHLPSNAEQPAPDTLYLIVCNLRKELPKKTKLRIATTYVQKHAEHIPSARSDRYTCVSIGGAFNIPALLIEGLAQQTGPDKWCPLSENCSMTMLSTKTTSDSTQPRQECDAE